MNSDIEVEVGQGYDGIALTVKTTDGRTINYHGDTIAKIRDMIDALIIMHNLCWTYSTLTVKEERNY